MYNCLVTILTGEKKEYEVKTNKQANLLDLYKYMLNEE